VDRVSLRTSALYLLPVERERRSTGHPSQKDDLDALQRDALQRDELQRDELQKDESSEAAETGALADLLRLRTREVHALAEKSGVLRDLIHGESSLLAYGVLLRNLLPVYQALEAGLEEVREEAAIRAVAQRAVYRSRAIESDLRALCQAGAIADADWRELPLVAAAGDYAARVSEVASQDGARLLAHAYVRFLGDLNGGPILGGRVARAFALAPHELSMFAYPEIEDRAEFTRRYRSGFDRAAQWVDCEVVVQEALRAFRLNIDVSEQVQRSVG